MIVLYTFSLKNFLISSTTSNPKFVLESSIVNNTPSISRVGFNVFCANMIVFNNCVIPSNAKNSHCTGIITEFDAVNASQENKGEGKDTSDKSAKTESKGFLKGGCSAEIKMELQIRNYPYAINDKGGKGKTFWHLYIGKPTPENERCRITFIDFEIGKDKPVGLWAKVYANAYLCMGNELPDNGALPPVPDKVLEALGMKESGLDILIKKSYDLLGLMSFLTAGEPEVRAWTIKKGTKAPQAAGKIHSDIERGFIKAEVVSYNDLIREGSMVAAREKGLIRSEGKEYIMQDGDIVLFKFNV
jgi:hypothetical protein